MTVKARIKPSTVNTGGANAVKRVPLTPAQQKFVSWLRATNPALYNATIPALTGSSAPDISGDLAGLAGGWSDFASAISKVGATYVQTRAQLATIKANAARANQGLPPTEITTAAPSSSSMDSIANFLRDNQLLIVAPLLAFVGWKMLRGKGRR